MNFQKYTNKLQNIIQEAQTLAVSLNNTSLGSAHLLASVLADKAVLATLENAGATNCYLKSYQI